MIRRAIAWCMEPVDAADVGCWPLVAFVAMFWLTVIVLLVLEAA